MRGATRGGGAPDEQSERGEAFGPPPAEARFEHQDEPDLAARDHLRQRRASGILALAAPQGLRLWRLSAHRVRQTP